MKVGYRLFPKKGKDLTVHKRSGALYLNFDGAQNLCA